MPKQDRPLAESGIDLERRAMLRHLYDGTREPLLPKGISLTTDLSKAPVDEPAPRLEDEEVPREGVVITRKAQFTRWFGGERSASRHSGAQRYGQLDKSLREFAYSLGLNSDCTLQLELFALSN